MINLLTDISLKVSIYPGDEAEGLNDFKETEKGRDIVSEIVERYARQYSEKVRIITMVQNVKNLIKNTSFTLDQILNILEVSEADRAIIIKALQKDKKKKIMNMAGKYDFDIESIESLRMKSML